MIPHTNIDGTHNDDEHSEMAPFEGVRFAAEMTGCDLSAYDTFMVVYVRGNKGALQQMIWPMNIDPKTGLPN